MHTHTHTYIKYSNLAHVSDAVNFLRSQSVNYSITIKLLSISINYYKKHEMQSLSDSV